MAVNWDKVPNLPPNLRAVGNAFNRRFPNRDGASDGAWGDERHKLSPSGHNLDDTAGSRPETDDADRKPELRAIDVDADLREPGVTMQDVWDAAIADPDFQARYYYVIYNGRIAGEGTGWKWRPYEGDNRHDKHGHVSGKPGADENGAAVAVIENYGRGGGGELSERASDLIESMAKKSGTRGLKAVPEKDSPFQKIEQIFDRLGPIEAAVNEIKTRTAAGTRAARSDSDDAMQANAITALSIERNLTAATTKQLEAELSKRDDRS